MRLGAAREWAKWVWLALALADVFWELSGYFVHGASWDHLTLSQIVKRWEGIDPVTGQPVASSGWLLRRGLVALGLVATCVVLILHWVVQVF